MPEDFPYDVFLSHSAKDKPVVRDVAERLRKDGLRVWFDEWEIRPGDSIPAKIEEGLERSRVLVLCMSANAFGSDWAQLESGTFRFRDPLNKERRFLPLRLDDAPIKGSLAQFLYINWRPAEREQEYVKLLEACRPPPTMPTEEEEEVEANAVQLRSKGRLLAFVFSPSGNHALTGGTENIARLWDAKTGLCLLTFRGHASRVNSVALSNDQRRILTCSSDKTMRMWDFNSRRRNRVFQGHTNAVRHAEWSADNARALSGSDDGTMRLWDIETGQCLRVFEGHYSLVWRVMWSADQRRGLSCSDDHSVRQWDIETGECLRVFGGHTGQVRSIAWSADQRLILSGSHDRTIRVWEADSARCLRVLEGHANRVTSLALNSDASRALSGSSDNTVRLWDIETGRCLLVLRGHKHEIRIVAWSAEQRYAFSGDKRGGIRVWDLEELTAEARASASRAYDLPLWRDQIEYTNAKVLLVGDTHSGKTGLTHRLATGEWKPSEDSTVGAWSTQWQLKAASVEQGVERDIWLWDFGGQADQRLIHQLYMDRTALILLLFNADQEDVLPGLRDWQTALRRSVKEKISHFLVAGRIDTGFKASRGKLQAFAKEQGLAYHETSAKDGTGCDELRAAMIAGILGADGEAHVAAHFQTDQGRDPEAAGRRAGAAHLQGTARTALAAPAGRTALHGRDLADGDRPAGRSRRGEGTRLRHLHPARAGVDQCLRASRDSHPAQRGERSRRAAAAQHRGREADLPEHRARRRSRGDEAPAARRGARGAGRDGAATGAARPLPAPGRQARLPEPLRTRPPGGAGASVGLRELRGEGLSRRHLRDAGGEAGGQRVLHNSRNSGATPRTS